MRSWAPCSRGRSSIPAAPGATTCACWPRQRGFPGSRVDEMLRLVELNGAGNRRVKGYSLGMRQRLSLAGALLGDPRALVLDEPANGLDPQGIRWLRDFLRAQASEGRTVLVSSHVLAEMAQTVDEVVVISRGKLVAQGSLDELTHGVEAPIWVRTPEAERLRAALAAREGVDAKPAEAGGRLARGARRHARGGGHDRGRERHPRVRAVPAAPVARARVPGAHRGHGGGPVIRLIGAELLKLRTTRTFWALAGSAMGLVLLIVVLSASRSTTSSIPSEDRSRSSCPPSASAASSRSSSAWWSGAGEYRHGTIASTLLVTPNRLQSRRGAGDRVRARAGSRSGSWRRSSRSRSEFRWLSAKDVDLPAAGDLARRSCSARPLYAGLAAALGVALGALLRNQVAAVVSLLSF